MSVIARRLRVGDIAACPKLAITPQHYRPDGTCRCGERPHLLAAIAETEQQLADLAGRLRVLKEQLRTS